MKRTLFILTIFLTSLGAFSQTAVNFSCNDCAGVNHDLFTELDSGKVVILCWVMPCSSCIAASKTTYNVAQSFNTTYPGRVKMYVCDDYANTSCSSLNSWCNQNGLTNTTKFSNASIKISDYGAAGMPKIVVIGNYSHHVYYNANNTVNATTLSTAITTALEDFTLGIAEPVINQIGAINSYPNPVKDQVSFSFKSEKPGSHTLCIFNSSAIQVSQPKSFGIKQGENIITISTRDLKNGIYFAHLQTDSGLIKAKFVVSH